MTIAANLGFPRIGEKRELKKAQEQFWAGKIDEPALRKEAKRLRIKHWKLQQRAGIESIPSGDFSLYDQMLDIVAMLGAVPSRFNHEGGDVPLDCYFAMARGTADAPAMEMTKWFDTNYHYIVPELSPEVSFDLSSSKWTDEFKEAAALGIKTRPTLVGPVTFLKLAKVKHGERRALEYLSHILPVYAALLAELKEAGADWVQIDEPILCLDLEEEWLTALQTAYQYLSSDAPKIMLASYFGSLEENLSSALRLPIAGLHLDLVRGPDQLERLLQEGATGKVISLGVVDGRNVWRNDLSQTLEKLERLKAIFGESTLQIAPSCSLLHVPVDLELESEIDGELRQWLVFAKQKLEEVAVLAGALKEGRLAYAPVFEESDDAAALRRLSQRLNIPEVRGRSTEPAERAGRAIREAVQREKLALPRYPTTTIGSFPQTDTVRKARLAFKKGAISAAQYDQFLEEETRKAIEIQEKLDLDVLVHGEFERTDMVEHFGAYLQGMAVTKFGWVQSYGSRCVKPPIIYGDIQRKGAMTVRWAEFAQACTAKPVKGMLTGPVTILQWSFVRNDQPRMETCRQIGLAIQDEVLDLQAAGIQIIQIDEPAIREGLPLRNAAQKQYLYEAVECFKLAANKVLDSTQIHTHMCYSEFDDILPAIAAMDVDVISIEASRSSMDILKTLDEVSIEAEVGLGVYDIHSPRCPSVAEMEKCLSSAEAHLRPEQLWVNPDCGLKTRQWDEVIPALENMVLAAKAARQAA